MLKNRLIQSGKSRVFDELEQKKKEEDFNDEDFDEDEDDEDENDDIEDSEEDENEEELNFEDLLLDVILKYCKNPVARKLQKDIINLLDVMEENE